MALSANAPQKLLQKIGQYLWYQVAAGETFYVGSYAGINRDSGYCRPLTNGDLFCGVCVEYVDNSAGSNGDKYAKILVGESSSFKMECTLTTAAWQVGADVFATDDATLSLSSGSRVGRVIARVDSSNAVVRFEPFTEEVIVSSPSASPSASASATASTSPSVSPSASSSSSPSASASASSSVSPSGTPSSSPSASSSSSPSASPSS